MKCHRAFYRKSQGGIGRTKFLGERNFFPTYKDLERATAIPHDDVAAFVRARKLYGRGIGWVDAHLLASALVDGLKFRTAGIACAKIAKEPGIAWEYDFPRRTEPSHAHRFLPNAILRFDAASQYLPRI
jgi:hypothetical protein